MIVLLATSGYIYGRTNPAEVISIKQIHWRSLAKATTRCEGVAPGTSTSNGPELPRSKSRASSVEPIFGHPVIGGGAAKDRAGLEANDCFSTFPTWGTEGVTSGNEGVLPVASDAADSPYGTAVVIGGRGPCCHAGRIVYRDAYEPAMKRTAIHHTPVTNIKNVAHDAECRSLLLNGWIKVLCRCM